VLLRRRDCIVIPGNNYVDLELNQLGNELANRSGFLLRG